MDRAQVFDRAYNTLKQWQRRYLLSEYSDDDRRRSWFREGDGTTYQERLYPVLPNLEEPLDLLIFKPDELGDAVHALPAIGELRARFPTSRFFLMCSGKAPELYARTGLFDEIAVVPTKPVQLGLARVDVRPGLAQLSKQTFDLSIFLRTYPALFTSFLKVPATARWHANDPRLRSQSVYRPDISLWGNRREHHALQLLELIAPLTGKTYSLSDVVYPELHWTDDDRRALEIVFPAGVPEQFLVVHPYANMETRRYPMEYWDRLLRRLHEHFGLPIVTVGGPGDTGLGDIPGVVHGAGRLSVTQTGYLLTKATGFVGNLSGPAHLAAALGVPTITLMSGHSLPVEWAPINQRSGRSLLLRAPVPCVPCHRRVCPGYGLACLTELRPEVVWEDVERFLVDALHE